MHLEFVFSGVRGCGGGLSTFPGVVFNVACPSDTGFEVTC